MSDKLTRHEQKIIADAIDAGMVRKIPAGETAFDHPILPWKDQIRHSNEAGVRAAKFKKAAKQRRALRKGQDA